MLTYILQTPNSIAMNYPICDFHVIGLRNIIVSTLPYIHTTSIKQFEIPLTELEIDYFNNHYSIWSDFLDRDQEVCLIIDQYQTFLDNIDTLFIYANDIEDNELIIPYQPFQKQKSIPDLTYSYGYKMDTSVYYINKSTAKILSSYKIIERTLDEFFISLSEQNKISISIVENKINTRPFNNLFFNDRNLNKLNKILSTSHWTAKAIHQVSEALCYIFEIAIRLQIPMFLSDGSLLGLIRHNCIMGWDDDIDITIDNKYVDRLFSQIEEENIYKITKHLWKENTIYYKMWGEDGNEIPNYSHRFPFVDIWTFDNVKETIEFSYRPSIDSEIIFPLKIVNFYHFKVKIPNNPQLYLDELFPNWRTLIQIYDWNHQTETSSNPMLHATITTDLEGKMILEDFIICKQ